MSEQNKNNYPEFYEPSDSETAKDVEHLIQVSHEFNELFDSVMLDNMDEVKRHEIIEGRPSANLLKNVELDGETYTISFEERQVGDRKESTFALSLRDSEVFTRDISIQRLDGVYGREYISYRLDADGMVRRWDGGDMAAKMEQKRELDQADEERLQNEGADEIQEFALGALQRIANELPNSRLEEDMKLNNQPISLDEMQGLRDFLTEATEVEK